MIGWITTEYGPRVAMAFCGIVPALAAVAVGLTLWLKARGRLAQRGPVLQAAG
jgi:hypothetical protein